MIAAMVRTIITAAGRGEGAPEHAAQGQRQIAQSARIVPTAPLTIDVSGRLDAIVSRMPYGRDLACFDRDGRCVGFIAQPERMTIELVLLRPDPEQAIEAIRAGQQPDLVDLAAALSDKAPELRDWLVKLASSQPNRPEPKGNRGRPKGSARHPLDLTHDVWRAECLYEIARGRTAGEAITIVADRHHVASGTVRNNVGVLTKK